MEAVRPRADGKLDAPLQRLRNRTLETENSINHCGNGKLETEKGEQCDDANQDGGTARRRSAQCGVSGRADRRGSVRVRHERKQLRERRGV
jgi:hypothetical protein